ncbi:hypothetical protein [Corynebacterium anserum]|uniref:Uncharacterized protein n=1 Tax=Corynebacterium anserum TaxID=2684406 RepID=A0A7G7YQA4_9CORY|nr:hypothetical protein [Corynebacterium anserum]QNH96674.1 hypothetical protein GP473_08450 [Corynebacterium anserum]
MPETQTVLYATAESANHEYLSRATGYPVVADARELSALEHEHITLVPACTSRDLSAITQAAQTMRWLKERDAHRTLIVAEPLSGDTYAIARMRHHIRSLAGKADALLFVSATVNPFADAELIRRVRLARQFSEDVEVDVAFDDVASSPSEAWPTPLAAAQRLNMLGLESITFIRADLYEDPLGEQRTLFKDTALRAAVVASVERARHRAGHGDDGIATGLLADHGAGFAHSHGDEDHDHTHHHHHH